MSRLRIQKDLELSAAAGSIITTSGANEPQYTGPGSNGQVLTVVGGVPAWANTAADVLTSISYAPVTGILTYVDELGASTNINLPLEKFLASASLNTTTNILTLTLNDGSKVTVNMTDYLGYTFDIADALSNVETVGVGDAITFLGTNGFDVAVSAINTVTITPPVGTATGQVMTWNNTTSVWEAVTPVTGSTFTVAGTAGTNQTISAGDTLTITGAANGILVTGTATDTLTIALREQYDTSTGLTSGTTVTATQTPIASTLRVYRNGLKKTLTTDYTLSGTTVTFTTAFGVSGGAAGGETVELDYRY